MKKKTSNKKNIQLSKKVIKNENNELIIIKNKEENKNNWLEFTNPLYSEDNKRWEFNKIQEGQILEIYYADNEEEIKEIHKEKVSSHIMAAMHNENEVKKPYHYLKIKPKEETKEKIKNINKRNTRADSTEFLANSARNMIMSMRLKGEQRHTIINTVSKEFKLKVITVALYFTEVLKDIHERGQYAVEETLINHLQRYEELYLWFNENGYSRLALKTLERKERLMGMHDGENVNSLIYGMIDSEFTLNKYNLSKITNDDFTRLTALIKKTIKIIKD